MQFTEFIKHYYLHKRNINGNHGKLIPSLSLQTRFSFNTGMEFSIWTQRQAVSISLLHANSSESFQLFSIYQSYHQHRYFLEHMRSKKKTITFDENDLI